MSKKQQEAQAQLNALASQSANDIANLQRELQGMGCPTRLICVAI